MSETPSKSTMPAAAIAGAVEHAPMKSASVWERLAQDGRKNPSKWIGWGVALAVVAAIAIGAFQYFSSKKTQANDELGEDLQKALSETKPADRAERLRDVVDRVKGQPSEAWMLFTYARACKAAAESETKPDVKLGYYRRALEAATSAARDQANPLNSLPWKPSLPGSPANASLIARMVDHCQKQVVWLEKNGQNIEVTPKTDAQLSAKLTLLDPEGKEHSLGLKFFSKEAPHLVDGFIALAKDGFFEGTQVFGVDQQDPNTEDVHAVLLGSAFSKLAPDRTDIIGKELDYIGYTLPRDDPGIEAKKGRLAYDVRKENGVPVGVNPASLALCVADPKDAGRDRVVFAETSSDSEVLNLLSQLTPNKDASLSTTPTRVSLTSKPWKISKIQIDGQNSNPPSRAAKRDVKLPEVPAKVDSKPSGG